MRISYTNLVAAVTPTASSENASYPVTNLKANGRPFNAFRTTATGIQSVVVPFGSTKALRQIFINRINVTSVNLQGGNDGVSWPFDQAVTIKRCPYNWRYQYSALLTGFNYSYFRLYIPSQSTVDDPAIAAGVSYYIVGGLWLADDTESLDPWSVMYDVQRTIVLPSYDSDVKAGGVQIGKAGWPYARMTMQRVAKTNRKVPGFGDKLATMLEQERKIWMTANRKPLVMVSDDTTDAYVFNRLGDVAVSRRTLLRADSPVEWVESVTP